MKTKHRSLPVYVTPFRVEAGCDDAAEILSSADGAVVATRRRIGKGTVIALGYWAGLAYSADGRSGRGESGFVDFVGDMAEVSGAGPRVRIAPCDGINGGPVCRATPGC